MNLREFDPVTDISPILHFWPDLPETLPLSASLLEQALDWISKESDSRVHYYSAAEEPTPTTFIQPGTKKAPLKPKKVTTAVLADQIALLTDAIPALTSQMEQLRADHARLEGVVTKGQETSSPPNGFPSPDYTRKVGRPRLRKGHRASPTDQNRHAFASDGQVSFSGGRTCGSAGSRWI